ncbi:glycosyltransferase family 4 protein [Saccharolobus solfataricus]
MIGIVSPIRAFLKFIGGAEVHSKEVISRLAKKVDIILFPLPSEILNERNEICNFLDNIPFAFPEVVRKICESKYKLRYNDILYEYSKYSNYIKIIYDPNTYIHMDMSSKLMKAKLFLRSLNKKIYCDEYLSFDAYCLSKRLDKPLVTTIQSEIRTYIESLRFLYGSIKYKIGDPLFGFKHRYNFLNIAKFERIVNDPIVKYVLSVSEGALKSLNLKSEKIKVLDPGNAFDPKILQYRTKNKEDYLIFWARLFYLKGIFEIPYIVKELTRENADIKLLMFGKFFDNNEKERFFGLIKKMHLEKNIEWLGFISDEEKYKLVSKAKALIYPSHVDSFPLVILESLALGTPVIAYDLPGPRSVYKDLSAVKFVREFDVKSMVTETLNVLRMRDEDYFNLIYDKSISKFLEKYNSWDKVTDQILNYLL